MSAALMKIKKALFQNENVGQTIAKNTFWLSLSEFVGRSLRVAIIIYAARVLGASGWGTFSYLTSLAAVFTIFSDIGISTVLVREVAKRPEEENKYFSTTFFLKLALTVISFIMLVFITPFFTGIPISQFLLVAIGLLFIFDSFRRFGTSIFRAKERMEKEAFVNIGTQIIIVAGGFIALSITKTPESLATAYALGAGLGLVGAGYFLRDNIRRLFSGFDKELVRSIIKDAWPLSLAAIFGMLLVNIDTVMVGWFREAEYVGYYSAAQKPIALLYILPTLIVGGFFPALARSARENRDEFRRVFERAMGIIVSVAFPVTVGIMLTSSEIVTFVYGIEYAPAAAAFRILALTLLTAFPVSILIHGVFAYNKQKSLVPLWVTGAILNVVLNLLFIPRYGISGAAWASFITQLGINSIIWIRMKRINEFSVSKKIPMILLATFMMSIATIIAKIMELHVLVIIPVAVIAYFASLSYSGENLLKQLRSGLVRK